MAKFEIELDDEVVELLKKEAKRWHPADDNWDDFNPYDYSGGNFDDAYEIGATHADILSARDFLEKLGVGYE